MKRACFLFLLAVCVSANAAEIEHLHRVDENVYRGRQPRPGDYAELAHMGVKTVLDLRGGPIHKPHERKQVEAEGMRYVSVRLSGIFAPRYRQIAEILAVLEDREHGPVFVHCRRGDDRVSEVIACYRIAHDHWTNKQAYDEALTYHLNPLEQLMRRYIRHFDPGKLPPVN